MPAVLETGRSYANDGRGVQSAADEHYRSQFNEIGRLVRLQQECRDKGHHDWADAIVERIDEVPLSVTLWAIYPHRDRCQWEILLGTGGPADRVLVTTGLDGDVESATYQHQDWFTEWTDAQGQDFDLVEAFASNFYYGPAREYMMGVDW